jgi:hypothetical protein
METDYDRIYLKAKPYLDTRQNDIHIQISYDFAKRLLTCYPEADREVVLPAILLHDVGWKMVPEEKQLNAFGPTIKDKKTQRFHELEGARIAGEILTSLNYNEKLTQEIITIIDGHDTRLTGLSLNDKLVKDADKLCRFTPTGVNIDHTRFKLPRKSYLDWITPMIGKWFFTPEAKAMAHIALLEAKSEVVLKR